MPMDCRKARASATCAPLSAWLSATKSTARPANDVSISRSSSQRQEGGGGASRSGCVALAAQSGAGAARVTVTRPPSTAGVSARHTARLDETS